MTTVHPPPTTNQARSRATEHGRLVRIGGFAGALAVACTTVGAAIASAAGVSLEIDDTAIPIPAFAWWTIVGAAVDADR